MTTASADEPLGDLRPWRIMTWNVHGSARPDIAALADVVQRSSVDVVALQEIRRSQARRLAATLGWHHVWAKKHSPGTPLAPHLDEGLAVLTPHRLSHVSRSLLTQGIPVWSWRRRIALAVTAERQGQTIRLVDTHLAAHDAVDDRIEQARRLTTDRRLVARRQDTPLVVAGDLNAHGELEVLREFRSLGLVDPGGRATCPAHAPQQRLDYVLVPDTHQAHDVEIDDLLSPRIDWPTLSDHLPVLVELGPRPRDDQMRSQ